jgi:hypothetical protein
VSFRHPRRGVAPEQEEHRHSFREHGVDLVSVVAVENHVRRERLVGQLSHAANKRTRALSTRCAHANLSQPAGIRDGGGELRDGGAAHGGGDDRMLDPQKPRE